MACKSCNPDGSDFLKIVNIITNKTTKYGDNYTITVRIKDQKKSSLYGRVCLYESGVAVQDSKSFRIKPGETLDFIFGGTMPNRDVKLLASVSYESAGVWETCQDARNIYLKLGTETEEGEDPQDKPASQFFNDLSEWIEENPLIIIVFVILIVIALIMRRK